MALLSNLDFEKDILPFIIATAGEFAALYYWLHFMLDDRFWLANGLLWAGFLVERIAVVVWLRSVYRAQESAGSGGAEPRADGPAWLGVLAVLGVTLSEILIWVSWVWVVDRSGHVVGAVYLLALMQVEHSVEMAILKRAPPFRYLTNGRTLFFTLMEVVGAVGWLYATYAGQPMAGAAILLVGLSVEHIIQGGALKPEPLPAA